jgi:hypothetical protein
VRVRPLIESMDGRPGENPLLHIDEAQNTLQIPALAGREPKAYKLDAVFGPDRPTSDIYDQVFSDSISRMLQGYNATIFACVQTPQPQPSSAHSVSTELSPSTHLLSADSPLAHCWLCACVSWPPQIRSDRLGQDAHDGRRRPVARHRAARLLSDL